MFAQECFARVLLIQCQTVKIIKPRPTAKILNEQPTALGSTMFPALSHPVGIAVGRGPAGVEDWEMLAAQI